MIGASIIIFINILLDWILIFGKLGFPALGAKGSAIATTIAQITGFIFIMSYYFSQKILNIELHDIVNFDKQIIVNILKLAFPASLQEAAFDISRLISIFMIMHLGTVALQRIKLQLRLNLSPLCQDGVLQWLQPQWQVKWLAQKTLKVQKIYKYCSIIRCSYYGYNVYTISYNTSSFL